MAITEYGQLSAERAQTLIQRLGDWVLVNGVLTKAIFSYPTETQVLSRQGGNASGETMKALLRQPAVYLHRQSGDFQREQPLRVLCKPESPDFWLGEFFYNEGAMYKVLLVEQQSDPVDTKERKWR